MVDFHPDCLHVWWFRSPGTEILSLLEQCCEIAKSSTFMCHAL